MVMEPGPDLGSLQGRNVTLPGGRDKDGRPILLVTLPPDSPALDVVPVLQYLASIFSNETRLGGFTVILDARKGPWKVARSCIRQVTSSFSSQELNRLIVLRPDAFWDKQRVENCTNTQNDAQVMYIPRNRLGKFVDQYQLPLELGGCFVYNHDRWIENRLKIEEFHKESAEILKELDRLYDLMLKNKNLGANEVDHAYNVSLDMMESVKMLAHNALVEGRELIQKLEFDNRTRKFASESEAMTTPQDMIDSIHKIEDVLNKIRDQNNAMEQAWKEMEKSFVDTKDLSVLGEGVAKVTNWILGIAENLLNSKQKVGYDVSSAEQLRREHEELELQCWETYGTYAELLYKINSVCKSEEPTEQLKDLIFQKDFMDFVCRSFASRLERRRNVLITSLRFFRLVSEYFDRTSEVFESLVMGNRVEDFAMAGKQLRALQENQANLDAVERELVKEGEKLSDMLSIPVKDALGREIEVDYIEDIINIRDILDATTARKNIFSDSVELQKLTLEQVTHIYEYEKDVVQAVRWLDELFQVLLQHHGHVGCTVYEIQAQKDDHQAFQETAKGTYNYGCQLLNASLALRQSCKLPIEEHENLVGQLENAWQKLLAVSQEQMTRLRVSAVFHRSVEEQCNQLRDLREAVATIPLMDITRKRARVKHYFAMREKLLVEVGRMVRLGRLLRGRLKEPLIVGDEMSNPSQPGDPSDDASNNAIAIEAITERLTEVTGLAEDLDQALRSAQQDCSIPTTSGTSTSVSVPILITPAITTKRVVVDTSSTSTGGSPNPRPPKPDDMKSDEEFLTASDGTLQHSRSSSYNTASECEHRYSPWWEFDKNNAKENIAKEKMVLAVGLPELPPADAVLKSSPEVPPGKIVREVTETTHLKVQHSYNMGVSSFVLTSETVKEKDGAGPSRTEEVVRVKGEEKGKEEQGATDDELIRRMKEVGPDGDGWKNYQYVTKQAIKGFL